MREPKRRFRRDDHKTKQAVYGALLVVALAASGTALWDSFSSKGAKESLADQLYSVCVQSPDVAKNEGLNCAQAQEEAQPGPAGDRGPRGPRGSRGPEGPKGDRGPTGPKGDRGDTGNSGSDGSDGQQGEPGVDGEDGDRGSQGERGKRGEQGPQGERGPAGPKGDQGSQGPTGPPGPRGKPGPPPSSFQFTYLGISYTCTPSEPGSTQFTCSPNQGESIAN